MEVRTIMSAYETLRWLLFLIFMIANKSDARYDVTFEHWNSYGFKTRPIRPTMRPHVDEAIA